MARGNFSREELFALVWEKPASAVAAELGVSDVAVGKLCARLQVPKPPRGYWARVQSGQTPRQPPLAAFREEIDRARREAVQARAAQSLSPLQEQFYRTALSHLKSQGIDVGGAALLGKRLPRLDADLAAQLLLLIQSRGEDWVEEGRVTAKRSHSVQASAANLVAKLLPAARPQLLVFEGERQSAWAPAKGPTVLVRLTARLQERIAALVRIIRDQKLRYVVMPLTAADHAWSVTHIWGPETRAFLDSTLCVSSTEIWVESRRQAWREADPPERIATGRLALRAIMPIDHMPVREVTLPPVIGRIAVAPYRQRLRGLVEAERLHEMLANAAYAIEREVPDETLALADRIWFGSERPFRTARAAWRHLEGQLELWDTELESERAALAQAILGIDPGDVVVAHRGDRPLRLFVTGASLYAGDTEVTFIVSGIRFRKDGTLGKQREVLRLHFANQDECDWAR